VTAPGARLALRAALPWLLGLAGATAAGAAEPARAIPFSAFGHEAEIGTLGGESANAALEAARDRVAEIEKHLAEVAPGDGAPHPADKSVLELLDKAQGACFWSDGLLAPFGRGPALEAKGPRPEGPALCYRARIDRTAGTVALAPGARLDLREFAAGFAVDGATEVLKARGLDRGWVRIGDVRRVFGEGLRPGSGFWIPPPPQARRLDPDFRGFSLRDRAFAVAATSDDPPHLDQRTGQGASGSAVVLAVADLAVDAQLLAATMLLAGSRAGELRLGSLRSDSSILWLYGTGEGLPLYVEHKWSEVRKK